MATAYRDRLPTASRREVLIAGGGGLALMGAGAIAQPAGASATSLAAARPALFLLDRSLAGSAEAAGAIRHAKVPLAEFAGDIGAVWLDRLEPLWREGPRPIAGVTYGGSLFCAEQLARGRGLVRAFCRPLQRSAQSPAMVVALAIEELAQARRDASDPGPAPHDLPVVWAMVPRVSSRGLR